MNSNENTFSLDVLEGYNGTIFAYGQTSSGKTHTMEVRNLKIIFLFMSLLSLFGHNSLIFLKIKMSA